MNQVQIFTFEKHKGFHLLILSIAKFFVVKNKNENIKQK